MSKLFIALLLAAAVCPAMAQSKKLDGPCSTYFAVVQYDPNVPGHYRVAMSKSQASGTARTARNCIPAPVCHWRTRSI
jgi:hypothetical protein